MELVVTDLQSMESCNGPVSGQKAESSAHHDCYQPKLYGELANSMQRI